MKGYKMASTFLNLSTDTTLGGNYPSDSVAVSQKAIKTYVDNNSGSGSSYTAGTGIDITNNTISVTSPTLINTAVGTDSLVIFGSETGLFKMKAVCIGSSSQAGVMGTALGTEAKASGDGVAIGYDAVQNTNGLYSVSIGAYSGTGQEYSVSLGAYAITNATRAIQIGEGANSEASSLYIGFGNNTNYKLLGSTGLIPSERIAIDGTSITVNSSGQLQAIGVIDNNGGNALKTWTGTLAEYNAIVTKDSNTLYNITDDNTAVAYQAYTKSEVDSLIEAIYPVGSIYIGTQSTCPLATLISGSTWVKVSEGRVLQGSDSGHNAGTTIEAGVPNITGTIGIQNLALTGFNGHSGCCTYDKTSEYASQAGAGTTTHNLKIDASLSSSVYGNSSTVQPPAYVVNIWQRTA
jgi:hypothetical protein